MKKHRDCKIKSGFTLIELLVVIAIIALLLSILMPSLSKVRTLAKRIVCSTNQHDMGIAFNMYSNSNNDNLPLNTSTFLLWDLAYATTDFLLDNGCVKETLYCPTQVKAKSADNAICWQFYNVLPGPSNENDFKVEPTTTADREAAFRVLGYTFIMDTIRVIR